MVSLLRDTYVGGMLFKKSLFRDSSKTVFAFLYMYINAKTVLFLHAVHRFRNFIQFGRDKCVHKSNNKCLFAPGYD